MLGAEERRNGVRSSGAPREEIQNLWDELMTGKKNRGGIWCFSSMRIKAPLLAGIKKYFEICEEEKELAVAASDQTRLLGRGSRDPGRLLREEKMRKRVSKEKLRLEQDLLASIPAWEEESGRTFLVHGETFFASCKNLSVLPIKRISVARLVQALSLHEQQRPLVKRLLVVLAPLPNKRMKYNDDSTSQSGPERHSARTRGGNMLASENPRKPVESSSFLELYLFFTTRPIAMPIPKPGTQHHALGHGRVPTSGVFAYTGGPAPSGLFPKGIRSASSTSGGYADNRYGNGSGTRAAEKKASRARRESFKPRPSMDADDHRPGTKWAMNGFGGVKEEEEGY
ncbi:hypothetical protein BT96DRAFT_977829 [Gymnopus androsaceus JB14]|uniref:Uncharacterized protein n=1 Tax=Gymnopus androsaceus JB14 TaxID=1447944 RepID=A0A6A4HD14_9AGAR|nr:hypothetical protein BT96DRAFT_977829 [Gymnopus androsaceus JB14]